MGIPDALPAREQVLDFLVSELSGDSAGRDLDGGRDRPAPVGRQSLGARARRACAHRPRGQHLHREGRAGAGATRAGRARRRALRQLRPAAGQARGGAAHPRPPAGRLRGSQPRMKLATVTLDDKYALDSRPRVPDRHPGAGAPADDAAPSRSWRRVSTPRATSPAIAARRSAASTRRCWQRQALPRRAPHQFQPGVNEDLAATAVWGSAAARSVRATPTTTACSRIWYAKGPGVDRSRRRADARQSRRHRAATAACWLLAGDDHTCKSSTTAHQIGIRLHRRRDPGAESGRRAGIHRFRPLRLRDVALFRLLGRA